MESEIYNSDYERLSKFLAVVITAIILILAVFECNIWIIIGVLVGFFALIGLTVYVLSTVHEIITFISDRKKNK